MVGNAGRTLSHTAMIQWKGVLSFINRQLQVQSYDFVRVYHMTFCQQTLGILYIPIHMFPIFHPGEKVKGFVCSVVCKGVRILASANGSVLVLNLTCFPVRSTWPILFQCDRGYEARCHHAALTAMKMLALHKFFIFSSIFLPSIEASKNLTPALSSIIQRDNSPKFPGTPTPDSTILMEFVGILSKAQFLSIRSVTTCLFTGDELQ